MPYSAMGYDRLENINFDRMRKYRLQRTRDAMARYGIGTLITWDPYMVRYISGGYVTVPNRYCGNQGVILPRNGDPHCYFVSSFSPIELSREAPWLNGKVFNGLGPWRFNWTQEEVDSCAKVALDVIAEHGLTNEPVALDACAREVMYIDALHRGGVKEVVDGNKLCFEARSIKNEDEIACLKMAITAADAAFEDMRQIIRPGTRECELLGTGMKRLYDMGCDEVQEFVVASGPRTNPMHIDFTDRAIKPGDVICIDVNGASYMGYKSCYYRTFICGKANQQVKDVYEECRKMMYDAIEVIKPGACVDDIRAVWPKSPEYWGYHDWNHVSGYALGHGIGLSLHEQPAMFFAKPGYGPNTVFEEGMTIAIETWAGPRTGGYGVRLEEDLVVTKDGYEIITKWPVDEITECWI